MNPTLSLGLIGLDTSHVIAFTKLLNDAADPYHVPGARIVAGFSGGSSDFELSWSRVDRFTDELRDRYGVEILESPEAAADRVDALLITACDGRTHRDLLQRVAPAGKPVFIDKPLATTTADARAILDVGKNLPVMSCSSLRYAQPLVDALADAGGGAIVGADCCGPMAIEPTQPGLFWYGVHTVEMLYAIVGPGCETVQATTTQDHDVIVGTWSDGRIGTFRGYRNASGSFGASIHRKGGLQCVDASAHPRPAYAGMLEHVIGMFRTGRAPIPASETLEIIRFMEAANESRDSGSAIQL